MDSEVGAAAREHRAAALDAWLGGLLPDSGPGVALVAVGGLGRRECAPFGDVDLVLLHSGVSNVELLAKDVWYPIWDAGIGLDHSVRTLPEALSVAHDDVKVALGLLDMRHVAGDRSLTDALRAAAVDQWRRTAVRGLSMLRELTAERWAVHGELAFLLEGDLKEARGGLRDVGVLRGIGIAGVADAARPAVRAAHVRLLDTRDALHVAVGRRIDRLVAQERAEVAGALGLPDAGALLRRVAQDARTVAYAIDDAWRAADRWRADRRRGSVRRQPLRRPVARDVVEQDGEAVLARSAVTAHPDPSLALRVAAAAAGARLPVARGTLEWLARFAPALPVPWPPAAREALLTLLGSSLCLVPTWEACDRYGLIDAWLPEWARLRSLPQYNPVHRFTVDRHLVEAAAHAAAYAREVDRPDLLLLAAFLHDIGKGLPGDHSLAGAPIAAGVATRIGLSTPDVATIEKLVRLHLLLPETATRRDLADEKTIRTVADAVGDRSTLDLLYALARADAAATGPGAWSDWKGRLVAELVDRVRSTLDTGAVPSAPVPDTSFVRGTLPAVLVDEASVSVAATDRLGLLAAVAGCLALHRLDVVAADVSTVDGMALVRCAVQPRHGELSDAPGLAADLRRAAAGQLSGLGRLAAPRPSRAGAPAPRVVWHEDAATDAVVLELRAADAPGLLYRVASALAGAGADVRAARISTLGADVVDAFYLVGEWNRATVEAVVLKASQPG